MLDHITPVLLTYNEEQNIGRTLSRLKWAKDVVVVDSGSTDRTLTIIAAYPNVRVFKRRLIGMRNSGVMRSRRRKSLPAGSFGSTQTIR